MQPNYRVPVRIAEIVREQLQILARRYIGDV